MKRLFRAIAQIAALAALLGAGALPAGAQQKPTLDQIKERGTLRIGVAHAPPWFVKDPRSGKWTGGLGISMGQAMADALKVKLEPVEITWGTTIAALQSGKIDIQLQLDATPERALAVDFPPQSMDYVALSVLAKDDFDASNWAAMDKPEVSVAVPQASSMDAFVTRTLTKANIQRFPDNAAAIAAFQSGRVQAVVLFFPPLLVAQQKLGSGKLSIPQPAFTSPASAGVRREDDKSFRDWVGHAISYYYETGQTQRWYEDYLKEAGIDPKSAPPIQRELMYAR